VNPHVSEGHVGLQLPWLGSAPANASKSSFGRNRATCCGSGSWGGQRPSLADYVARGGADGATAVEGR